MADLAELIKRLRRGEARMDDEQDDIPASAGPAQIMMPLPPELTKESRTIKKTPITGPAKQALGKSIEQLQAEEQAALQEREDYINKRMQQYQQAREQKKLVPPEFKISPETEKELAAYESLAQQEVGKSVPEQEGMSPLNQAIVTFGPAFAGALIGKLSKEPGMAAGGFGIGAGAGVKAVEQSREEQKKKYELAVKQQVEKSKLVLDLIKKRMSQALRPEEVQYKARAEAFAQNTEQELRALDAQLAADLKNNPADTKLKKLRDDISKARGELAEVTGKVPEVTTIKGEKAIPPKAAKPEAKPEAKDQVSDVIYPGLVVMDPERKWDKKDRQQVQKISSSMLSYTRSISDLRGVVEKYGREILVPGTQARRAFDAAKETYLAEFANFKDRGANFTLMERGMGEKAAVPGFKGITNLIAYLSQGPAEAVAVLKAAEENAALAIQDKIVSYGGKLINSKAMRPSAQKPEGQVLPGVGKVLYFNADLKGNEAKAKRAEAKGYRVDRSK